MAGHRTLGAALALVGAVLAADIARAEPVAVELLLAVDASVSVNPNEFDLQVGGIARAFRSEEVLEAIRAVGADGIAVAVYHWGNVRQQRLAVDWMRVDDAASARALAARIAAAPRAFVGGATAIHSALDFAVPRFDENRFEGRRRVLDLSADGRNNRGVSPEAVRDRAVARGITINGLAILNDVPFLDDYFHRRVIGGAQAFVEVADDYDDFARAIRAKLVREITEQPAS
jgi:hypothetical protein